MATPRGASPSSSKSKGPKSRNSDARKEQNRIASKAYREKRKQKLALLDQLLHTEHQDGFSESSEQDSSSSVVFSEHAERPPGIPFSGPSEPAKDTRSYSLGTPSQVNEDPWAGMIGRPDCMFDDRTAFDANTPSMSSLEHSIESHLTYMPAMTAVPGITLSPPLLAHTDLVAYPTPSSQYDTMSPPQASSLDGMYAGNSSFTEAYGHFSRLSSEEQSELVTMVAKQKEEAMSVYTWDMANCYQSTSRMSPNSISNSSSGPVRSRSNPSIQSSSLQYHI